MELPLQDTVNAFIHALVNEDIAALAGLFVSNPELIECIMIPKRDEQLSHLNDDIEAYEQRLDLLKRKRAQLQEDRIFAIALRQATQQAFRVMAGNKFQTSDVPLWTVLNNRHKRKEK